MYTHGFVLSLCSVMLTAAHASPLVASDEASKLKLGRNSESRLLPEDFINRCVSACMRLFRCVHEDLLYMGWCLRQAQHGPDQHLDCRYNPL